MSNRSKSFFLIKARIFAVKSKQFKDSEAFKDVELSGNTIVEFLDGNAFFVGTKFTQTSFHN
jgi:hypothetical protein